MNEYNEMLTKSKLSSLNTISELDVKDDFERIKEINDDTSDSDNFSVIVNTKKKQLISQDYHLNILLYYVY